MRYCYILIDVLHNYLCISQKLQNALHNVRVSSLRWWCCHHYLLLQALLKCHVCNSAASADWLLGTVAAFFLFDR